MVVVSLPLRGPFGRAKRRPALVLALLPGDYQTVLVCGLSSDLDALEPDWDDVIATTDPDFPDSGLVAASSARLSFLFAVDEGQIDGLIGQLSRERASKLSRRLNDHLAAQQQT